ncbi:MAG: TonB-dependent receptor [Bacteroidota bacterium]|nr:TonB-dependent receptor [Bacteroidota bacterium]
MNRIILFILLLFFGNLLSAQNVTGRILTSSGNGKTTPLPGATVYWRSTMAGTNTDSIGTFELVLPSLFPSDLIIGMVGYENDTIEVLSEGKIPDIILKSNITLTQVDVEVKQSSTLNSNFSLINTEVIGKKELLKAACCNISESFSTNASVDVAFTDAVSGAKKIQMLGLDGIYTQVLSENMPLLRGLSSAYGLNYIPGTWVENILVTKGTGSVVNGYESISGQINLEFLKPKEQKERLFINLYGNHKSRAEANLHYTPKINEKWGSTLFLHASDVSLRNDMNNDSFLDMPLTRQFNIFNRWDYHNQKNFEAQFGVKALKETRQGGQTSFNREEDRGKTGAYGIGINTEALEYFSKTGFLFPSRPGKSIGIQTSGKWLKQDMFFGLRNYTGEQKNVYVNMIYADYIKTTDHKYKFGLSYLLDDYEESYNDSAFARTESVPGIFGEYTYIHAENFSLVAGIRADYHNLFGLFYTPRLHLRYKATKTTTLRLSGGRGFRTPNLFVENQQVFASSRQVIIKEKPLPEIAWNYGVSANQKFKLFGNEAFINVDFFRTDFENQLIVDVDQHVNKVVFYNLKGKSYSHSLQVDAGFEPIESFAVKAAYKWYDVKSTYNYELLDKPFVPKHRVMFNMAYATYMEIWKFDFTTNWFGQSRIPSTVLSPEEYRMPTHSKEYFTMNAQVTKKFRKFEIYLGVENILNYTQKNPIIAANDPFGTNFDASMVYAPVDGRVIYAGLRMSIK